MLELQIKNWDKVEKAYTPEVIKAAMNSSIRKSLMKTRTQISKNVRQTYMVKAGDIGKVVSLRKLSYDPAEYALTYFGYRISMSKFQPKPVRVSSRRGQRIGVSVKVRKDRGRKIVRGGFYGAGGWPIYKRKTDGTTMRGSNKAAIEKRSGIAIPQMVATKDQLDMAYRFMAKEVPKQLVRNLDFYMHKAAGM